MVSCSRETMGNSPDSVTVTNCQQRGYWVSNFLYCYRLRSRNQRQVLKVFFPPFALSASKPSSLSFLLTFLSRREEVFFFLKTLSVAVSLRDGVNSESFCQRELGCNFDFLFRESSRAVERVLPTVSFVVVLEGTVYQILGFPLVGPARPVSFFFSFLNSHQILQLLSSPMSTSPLRLSFLYIFSKTSTMPLCQTVEPLL